MHRGYIKVWRKIADADWLKNHKLCAFWLWCLIKASHKEYDLIVGSQQVHLLPGEFVFGLKSASKELKMSIQSIRTLLNFLKTSSNLTLKTTNKFSIISIVNWNTYQIQENEINTQINKQLTNKQQTTNNKQECKELKNVKNNTYTSEFLLFYNSYPKKKAKDDAYKAWKQQNGNRPSIDILLSAIEKQKYSDDWLKENGRFIPYPGTWLRSGRWDDEIENEEKLSCEVN